MKLDELFQQLQEGYDEPFLMDVYLHNPAKIRFNMQEIQIKFDSRDQIRKQVYALVSEFINHPQKEAIQEFLYPILDNVMGDLPENEKQEFNQIAEIFVTLLHAKLHEKIQKE